MTYSYFLLYFFLKKYNFKVKTGVILLKVASKENNYGTSKIIFR